ncbi:MAG: PhzF family phenazine biosynthesis protein [Acetobacteraceae bacterium]
MCTGHASGGNPLAIAHGAAGLDDGRMQPIAREFNLSETVFVTRFDAGRAEIRVAFGGVVVPVGEGWLPG